jgi:hypothetical protein
MSKVAGADRKSLNEDLTETVIAFGSLESEGRKVLSEGETSAVSSIATSIAEAITEHERRLALQKMLETGAPPTISLIDQLIPIVERFYARAIAGADRAVRGELMAYDRVMGGGFSIDRERLIENYQAIQDLKDASASYVQALSAMKAGLTKLYDSRNKLTTLELKSDLIAIDAILSMSEERLKKLREDRNR